MRGCGDSEALYYSSDGASGNIAPVSGVEDTVTICQKIIFDGDVVETFEHRHRNFKDSAPPVAELGLRNQTQMG